MDRGDVAWMVLILFFGISSIVVIKLTILWFSEFVSSTFFRPEEDKELSSRTVIVKDYVRKRPKR